MFILFCPEHFGDVVLKASSDKLNCQLLRSGISGGERDREQNHGETSRKKAPFDILFAESGKAGKTN